MPLDIDRYLGLTRLSGLRASADGRLLVQAARPDPAGTAFATEILELDPTGVRPPTRLAGRRPGLAAAGFQPDGSLLILDGRPDPEALPDEPRAKDEVPALWRVSAAGGEAHYVAGAPAGIESVRVARDAGTTVALSEVFAGATTMAEDRERATAREKAGTQALLFEEYPFRHWDSPLAPRGRRLFVVEPNGELRDLTGDVGAALSMDGNYDITPDGRTVLATWNVPTGKAAYDRRLVAIDVATGQRRTLLQDKDVYELDVACSPDGRHAAVLRLRLPTTEEPWDVQLWLLSLADGQSRQLMVDFDRFPESPQWSPDSRALVFVADDGGRTPLWRIDIEPDAVPVRLTGDGAFADVRFSPDGQTVYALHSAWDTPPEVVALDPTTPDQKPRVLHAIELDEPLPGRLTEVWTTAEDGTDLRAWLVLPESAEPSPLLVIPHGGPVSSWSRWSWRWQPQLFAAKGYAVLLPDPALSTGYGRQMLRRGWTEWGGRPYTDIMALTDVALRRPDLDADRTAVAGASYGGYMTNWIISHTDRFRCAISHAGIWHLGGFRPTTDDLVDWETWFGSPGERPEFYAEWSPATYVEAISTPTLVTHGERDYRCPVGEGLALYGELQRRGVHSALLYLPDENHWVQRPGNIKVWYQTVLAWLDRYTLGLAWERPELL